MLSRNSLGIILGIILLLFIAVDLRDTLGEIMKQRIGIFNRSYQNKRHFIKNGTGVHLGSVTGNAFRMSVFLFNNHRLDLFELKRTEYSIDPYYNIIDKSSEVEYENEPQLGYRDPDNFLDSYNYFIAKSSKVQHKCALQVGYTNSEIGVHLRRVTGNALMSGFLFNNRRLDRFELKRTKYYINGYYNITDKGFEWQDKSALQLGYTDPDDFIDPYMNIIDNYSEVQYESILLSSFKEIDNFFDSYNNLIAKSFKVQHKCALQLGYTNSEIGVQVGSVTGNALKMSGLQFNNHRLDRFDLKRTTVVVLLGRAKEPFVGDLHTLLEKRFIDLEVGFKLDFLDLDIGHFKVSVTKELSFTISYTGTELLSGYRRCKSKYWKHITTQHDTTWHKYGGLVLKGLYNLNILDYDLCGCFLALNKYQAAVWLFALLWIISWKSKVGFLMTKENQSKALPDMCERASTVEHKDFQDDRLEKLKHENDNRIMEINEQLRSILRHLDHKMKTKERKRPHSSI